MRILAALLLAASLTAASAAPVETYVEAPGPKGPLKGTMLSPGEGRGPVLLLIPGSGPTDRDGNNAAGLKSGTMKLLAEGLASEGITTVRIDKRGLYASAAAVADAENVKISDYAADVHSWVKAMREKSGASCLWVLGHSEGGLVALVAGQNGRDICGLILVSTPGRRLGTILQEQLKANPGYAPVLDQALSATSELESGRHVDAAKLSPALMPLFRPSVQDFLIDEMAQDPAKLAASYRGPVLIVQGARDIQVTEEDARQLKQAQPAASLALLPDTNHVLKVVRSDSRGANIATYADPSLPLAPAVVPTIAAFVKAAPSLQP